MSHDGGFAYILPGITYFTIVAGTIALALDRTDIGKGHDSCAYKVKPPANRGKTELVPAHAILLPTSLVLFGVQLQVEIG